MFADDDNELASTKRRRVFVDRIWQEIRSLSFADFEKFGGSILRELGCDTAKMTPHAGDQGIDFYGRMTIGNLLGVNPGIARLMHETNLIIVGQAKHYPERAIGPNVVRELVGALSLSRTKTFSHKEIDLLDDVDLRPFSPLLAMLFSTGEFTSGARQLAQRAGLITYSGWQLSVFLADRGVGIAEDGDFDEIGFNRWLKE